MAFDPAFSYAVDPLNFLDAAGAIVERDIYDALQWRANLDGSEVLAKFKRIQLSQRHSQDYPLLIIQPATDTPTAINGGIAHQMTFDLEIFATKNIGGGDRQSDKIDDLTRELLRYYGATRQCLISAPDEDWAAFIPVGAKVGNKFEPFCTNAVFGELTEATEKAGLYCRSVAFELQLRFLEPQNA